MQNLRKIGALSLLTLLLVKAMVVPAIFFNYELRKDFIIENFCVNKERPELNCDGQCYLAKQLKAAQEHDENEATATFVDKLLGFECVSGNADWHFSQTVVITELQGLIAGHQHLNGSELAFSIFHPPKVIS
ncbi:hypothetical protein [Arcticibacterium luteifluviistationis]|uniref:Uncharacterized protein n=1 Tax=Arcticibacterium luteifluviistationis TaxID=1784714 RepID=A0A2Z4GH32_9BACT|nr:hypothetical protein [Arcticibacterium luteifluviistationis]AWW00713.1 hypothetical protein DJ013_21995 [Arcticibacterium luteifluviistationis]